MEGSHAISDLPADPAASEQDVPAEELKMLRAIYEWGEDPGRIHQPMSLSWSELSERLGHSSDKSGDADREWGALYDLLARALAARDIIGTLYVNRVEDLRLGYRGYIKLIAERERIRATEAQAASQVLEQAEQELQGARVELDQAQHGVHTAQAELDQAQQDLETAQTDLDQNRSDLDEEKEVLAIALEQLARDQEQLVYDRTALQTENQRAFERLERNMRSARRTRVAGIISVVLMLLMAALVVGTGGLV